MTEHAVQSTEMIVDEACKALGLDRPPRNQRKFFDLYDELLYLNRKSAYWMFEKPRQRSRARRFIERLRSIDMPFDEEDLADNESLIDATLEWYCSRKLIAEFDHDIRASITWATRLIQIYLMIDPQRFKQQVLNEYLWIGFNHDNIGNTEISKRIIDASEALEDRDWTTYPPSSTELFRTVISRNV